MSEARNINTFNKKRFIKGLTISLLIVLAIESFRLTRVSDHNGGKFLAINMSRLGDMDGNKTGPAIVLQPHTIKTEYGDLRLKMFCSIRRVDGRFNRTTNRRYSHNILFFGQSIGSDQQIQIGSMNSDFPRIYIYMLEYKREKLQFHGQIIIPATVCFNYSTKIVKERDDHTSYYDYEYHKGISFYTTYTREDTSPITLNDGTVIYSETRYIIQAPEDEDWTIELDGDPSTRDKYIQFSNGKRIECEKVIIEPYWGKVKEVTTLDGRVLDYSELIENGYLPNS